MTNIVRRALQLLKIAISHVSHNRKKPTQLLQASIHLSIYVASLRSIALLYYEQINLLIFFREILRYLQFQEVFFIYDILRI